MMMNLFLAFCIMLTVVCILEIVVASGSPDLIASRIYGRSSQALNEEESERKLLDGHPAPASPAKEKIPAIL